MNRLRQCLFLTCAIGLSSCSSGPALAGLVAGSGNPAAGGSGGGGGGSSLLVYSGCAQPPDTNPGTTYYVKLAANGGSDAANGLTLATAWATPAHALATVSTSAGDTILLQSGNYGTLDVSSRNMSSFTTMKADTGQTPVFTGMTVHNATKWVFQGLKIQHIASGAFEFMINVDGTDTDIVFDHLDMSSAPFATVSGWTAAQWVTNAPWQAIELDAEVDPTTPTITCIAITNNAFKYIRAGVQAIGGKILIDNNTFDWMADDNIDHAGSHFRISRNVSHDTLNIGDGNHNDFIQGQIGDCTSACTYDDVVIDGNNLTELFSAAASVPLSSQNTDDSFQGISAFNESWSNYKVINNDIKTSTPSIISLNAISNGLIANNVALQTNGTDGGISVNSGSGNIIRNNIATFLGYGYQDATTVMDHNIAISKMFWNVTGSNQFLTVAGTCSPGCGTANTRTGSSLSAIFNVIDNDATPNWDLTLKAGSEAIGAGTATGAPNHPDGTARSAPVDDGAY